MTTAEGIRNILVDARVCAPERIKVLPTNVDFRRFYENVCGEGFRAEMGLGKDTPAVGMMAHLRSYKGYEYLPAAARLLKDEGCGARFFLGGDRESRGMYE